MTFGENIKRLRYLNALTQSELAMLCDVSLVVVNLWENDKSHPSPKNTRKLAKALNCSIKEITDIENY